VAGTQRWSAERIPQDRGSGPLPSFEMPSAEAIDPDKTLKRPRVRATSPSSPKSANSTEEISVDDVLEVADLDSVSTQEIDADDILDVIPLRQRIYPNPRIIHIPEGDPAHGMPAIPRPPATPWELAASSARAASLAATPPRPRVPTPRPPSYDDLAVPEASPPMSRVATIAPVAIDVELPDVGSARRRAESTFSLDTFAGNRSKRRRVDVAIAVTVGAFVGIFLLGLTLRSVSAKPVVQVGPLRASAAHAASTANAAAERSRAPIAIARAATETTSTGLSNEMKAAPKTGSTPSVDVSSLPQAQVGSISLASSATGHRLFVDGSVYASGSAVVSCGRHFVRVGSRGRALTVDVPCGTDVVVAQ
jgi:hypothetical protein